ncbi:hypothetical protein OSTOST_12908, partial [Ostertagia ostertagi]
YSVNRCEASELWNSFQIQVLLAPRYSAKEFCEMALLFLNIRMSTEARSGCILRAKNLLVGFHLFQDHRKYGAALWFQTMWKMYEVVEMGKKWGDDLPNFFATLIYHNPDFMDWGPLYDTIFTRIIRAMGLCVREGKITVGDGSGSSSLDGFARFVSSTIGGPCSCQKQLEKMMRTIEPFLHPANEGDHTALVLSFLQYLIREFLGRYEDERIKKIKRKVGFSELPAKLLMMLGTLEPGHVFPRFLDKCGSRHVYPAVFAVCEPHRLTQTLDCMFELVFIIASDEKQGIERRKMEKDWVAEMEKVL